MNFLYRFSRFDRKLLYTSNIIPRKIIIEYKDASEEDCIFSTFQLFDLSEPFHCISLEEIHTIFSKEILWLNDNNITYTIQGITYYSYDRNNVCDPKCTYAFILFQINEPDDILFKMITV